MKKRVFFAFLLIFCGFCASNHAAERFKSILPESTGVISANVRFYVTGSNRAENVEVAAWADEVATRLDDLVGLEIPRQSGDRLIQINLTHVPDQPRNIEISQYRSDVGMIQILQLQNVVGADQAKAVESLCRLLLCRAVLMEKGFPVLKNYDFPFPAWFLHGITSHFSSTMRLANRAVVIDAWQRGVYPALEQVITGASKTSVDIAAQGELFEWLNDMPGRREIFQRVIQRMVDGKSANVEWFVHDLLQLESLRVAAQEWDLHLLSLQHVLLTPGLCSPTDILVFRDALLVRPEVLGVATGEDVLYTYRLGDLVPLRREMWMSKVVNGMVVRINEAAIGKGPELGQVAALYLEFLNRLPMKSMAGYKGVFSTDTTDKELRQLLADADRLLALVEREVKARQNTGASSSTSSEH